MKEQGEAQTEGKERRGEVGLENGGVCAQSVDQRLRVRVINV